MRYLLDTCVISELVKPSPNSTVVNWLNGEDEGSIYLSALTFGELEKGVGKLPESNRKLKLAHWLEHDFHQRFRGRVLDIDEEVASIWGRLSAKCDKIGRPLHVIDGLLAATAISHGLTLVTRNTKDMQNTPVMLFNPWDLSGK